MAQLKGKALWRDCLHKQVKWMQDHGGDLGGYIANYHGTHGRTIENAEGIYNADLHELHRLQRLVGEKEKLPSRLLPVIYVVEPIGKDYELEASGITHRFCSEKCRKTFLETFQFNDGPPEKVYEEDEADGVCRPDLAGKEIPLLLAKGHELADESPDGEHCAQCGCDADQKPHLRINLNDNGTATYYLWLGPFEEGDYDFDHPLTARQAMKIISQGCTIDLTALDPDNNDRVFSNLDGRLMLEEN